MTEEDRLKQAIRISKQELEERIWRISKTGTCSWKHSVWNSARYDLEMLREVGYCSGIENYSRHFRPAPAGSPPWTLMDYLPSDYLLVLDESHMTIPQVRGMYQRRPIAQEGAGGVRLPAAIRAG